MRTVHAQRGAATLVVVLLLFVMTLVVGYAHRHPVVEQRAAVNHMRATQAFEMAEAGLEWTIARLNDPRPLNSACLPDAGGSAFRARVRAACARDGGAWSCNCPRAGDSPPPRDDAGPAPGFTVELAASPGPRLLQLGATGAVAGTTARLQVVVGLVPGIATLPAATLTVKDDVDAGIAPIGLHNTDATSSGIAVHAGGAVLAPNARWSAPAGAASPLRADHDTALNALPGDRLFASLFAIDKPAWRGQPAVTRIECAGACNSGVLRAAAAHRLLWVEGDLQLDGPIAVGSRERPVIVIAGGAVRLNGPVAFHGVLYGASLAWDGAGGSLRGAAISESGYRGNGSPDLVYDGALLEALRTGTGSFARLPGSWKDF